MQERKVLWPLLIAGWSGFYVMLVELLGGRFIAPYFGSSVYVWGSVIFVFMVGLAIGYLLGGIYSRHNPSVVRLCGILMVSATATLPMLLFGDSLLNFVFSHIIDPRDGGRAYRDLPLGGQHGDAFSQRRREAARHPHKASI